MGKRKKVLDDGSDSEDSDEENELEFDENDMDIPKLKKNYSQSKEAHIYGSFNEKESFTKPLKKKNVSFVSSKTNETLLNLNKQQTSSSFNTMNKTQVKLGVQLDQDFGKFNQHSKAIGLKLMQKMGYKVGEGLGSSKSGIVQPLESQLRPAKIGLAYNGFKENINKNIKDDDSNELEIEEKIKKIKIKEPKNKTQYQSAEELANKIEIQIKKPEIILDMRGKEVKALDNLNQSIDIVKYEEDINLVIDLSKQEVIQLENEKKIFNQKVEKIKKEIDESTIQLKKIETNISEFILKFKSLMKELIIESEEITNNLVEDSQDFINLNLFRFKNILLKLISFYNQSSCDCDREEIYTQITQFGILLISPIIKKLIVEWNVLDDKFAFISLFEDSEISIFFSVSDNEDLSIFDLMIYHIFYPKMRNSLVNHWNPRDCEKIISLIEMWIDKVHPYILDLILDQIVIPKLKNEVLCWDPRKDKEFIHHWIHPWLPIIAKKIRPISDLVLSKLTPILSEWHPSDPSALILLKPWKTVVKRKTFDLYCKKWIVNKLADSFKRDFDIDPSNQNMEPYKYILKWEEIISREEIEELFLKYFFPKFFEILNYWLGISPDFQEVIQWFSFWKSQMPESILGLESVKLKLKDALDLINSELSK